MIDWTDLCSSDGRVDGFGFEARRTLAIGDMDVFWNFASLKVGRALQ